MSNGPAKTNKTLVDEIVQLKKDKSKAFGLDRMARGVGSSKSLGQTGSRGNSDEASGGEAKIRTSGDTMVGPLAFYPKTAIIAAGVLDISNSTTGEFSSRVIVTGQGAAADDLDTITGAAYAGQILFLQATATTPITLKHATGNIWSPTLADYVVTDKEIVLLQYDTVNTVWSCVANFVASGGGGGGLDQDLANMTSPTVPTVDLDMNGNDITGVANIDLDGAAATVEGVVNLQFFQTSHSINSLSGIMLYQANTNDVHRFAIGGATKVEVQTSKLDIQNGAIDLNGGSLDDVNIITFNNSIANDYIESTLSGIEHHVNATDEHFFYVGGVEKLKVDSIDVELSTSLNMDSNNITNCGNLQFDETGMVITPSPTELLYQVTSGDKHGFYVAASKIMDVTDAGIVLNTNEIIDFGSNAISIGATAGFDTLPAKPVAFLNIKVGGASYRVPYYSP